MRAARRGQRDDGNVMRRRKAHWGARRGWRVEDSTVGQHDEGSTRGSATRGGNQGSSTRLAGQGHTRVAHLALGLEFLPPGGCAHGSLTSRSHGSLSKLKSKFDPKKSSVFVEPQILYHMVQDLWLHKDRDKVSGLFN